MSKKRDAVHFASLSRLVEYLHATPKTWKQSSATGNDRSRDWDLNAGYEGALMLARDGWQDGARQIAAGMATLPAHDIAPAIAYSVQGYKPSVGRYLSGNPRAMYCHEPQEGTKPAITLAVNTTATGCTDGERMMNYGLAVASYCEQLELAGYPVEIIAMFATECSGTRVVRSWTVKPMDCAANYADLAFSLAHPAMFRRLGFGLIERSTARDTWGYGSCEYLSDADLAHVTDCGAVLNGMAFSSGECRTAKGALELVKRQIDKALDGILSTLDNEATDDLEALYGTRDVLR